MGVVYRAQDPAIGRMIAIKAIRLSDLTDAGERERMRERLFREAQSAGVLSHPNIVTIYDVFEENGLAYIFMELVNGPTLEQILSGSPPSGDTFLSILRQTCGALDYAHKKGIVHRDIKPANIMVDESGAVKITDFGVAKVVSAQMTQSGTMMGTPNYMSPEQIQGADVDGRADQFAVAVIAYEVLTGEKPFAGDHLATLLYRIVSEDPVPARRMNPALGERVEQVLGKALSKDAGGRYATCMEFYRELQAACEASPGWAPMARGASLDMPTMGAPAARPVTVQAAPPPPKKAEAHTVRNVLLALAAVVILAGALMLSQHSNTPATPQVASQVETPKAPEPDKPSPVPAAEEKPTPPPETAPAETHPVEVPVPPAEPRSYDVQIMSSPGGAQVVVDDSPFCTTPCKQPLARGRHVVVVRAEGHRETRRVIEVPGEANLTIDLERLSGTLSVSSTPPGATIFINGIARAEKTPAVFRLPVGVVKLRVERDAVKSDEETVNITEGGMAQRRYILE